MNNNKINVRAYIEYLESKKFKLKRYKRIEELTVLKIDKTGAYPVAICKNQAGKSVKIGVTFLKLYYSKTKSGKYVLENREVFRAIPVREEMSFASSTGQTFHLKPNDYIVIDSKDKIFGETKENFEENYILAYKYSKTQAELREM